MMKCWLDDATEKLDDREQVDDSEMNMIKLHQFLHFQR